MDMRPSALLAAARSPEGQKMVRYTLVSVISVAVGQAILFLTFGVLKLFTASWDNVIAVCISAVPSYYLNRTWAWGKSGKSHLWREVVPFWALALAGLGFSTIAVGWTHDHTHHLHSHLVVALLVNGANVAAFGVLWVVKFVIFNKWMFVHHLEDLPEALDGRTGVPT
jgi:putative flippase GtrA